MNQRVVLFDQAGTWLLTIKGNVSGPQKFESSYGLALDLQRNIHVTAHVSSTFSPEGTYVRSYGSVHHPSGIVVDEEGYSLVIEETDNCLSIFDPQGNKIHMGSLLLHLSKTTTLHLNKLLKMAASLQRGIPVQQIIFSKLIKH